MPPPWAPELQVTNAQTHCQTLEIGPCTVPRVPPERDFYRSLYIRVQYEPSAGAHTTVPAALARSCRCSLAPLGPPRVPRAHSISPLPIHAS